MLRCVFMEFEKERKKINEKVAWTFIKTRKFQVRKVIKRQKCYFSWKVSWFFFFLAYFRMKWSTLFGWSSFQFDLFDGERKREYKNKKTHRKELSTLACKFYPIKAIRQHKPNSHINLMHSTDKQMKKKTYINVVYSPKFTEWMANFIQFS